MGFEIKGLKEVQEKLKFLASLDGKKITLGELLPPEFISAASSYSSVQELFDASGFTVSSQEDLEAIPVEKWDNFIAEHTSYPSWAELKNSAMAEWIAANQ